MCASKKYAPGECVPLRTTPLESGLKLPLLSRTSKVSACISWIIVCLSVKVKTAAQFDHHFLTGELVHAHDVDNGPPSPVPSWAHNGSGFSPHRKDRLVPLDRRADNSFDTIHVKLKPRVVGSC
ncbi:hypothetical protein BgiMline_028792 [Biomphalaria glabrata]|nr:hypothetical protein BgiMline_025444 [Biomphalaria glabrata]